MPKVNWQEIAPRRGSGYPPPHDAPCASRVRWPLGKAGGLTDFGVNRIELPPGAWSSQRHWHSKEEEFVYVLEGTPTLITDDGEQLLAPSDAVCFPKNVPNGHQLVNRSQARVVCLEVGTSHADDVCTYSDIDMQIGADGTYRHKDGVPYHSR